MRGSVYSGKAYAGIDIFKFYMSILVVLRHLVQRWCSTNSFLFLIITNGISTVAVPFFFVATGYLFFSKEENNLVYLKKQLGRLLSLYLVWSLIYLPVKLLPNLLEGKLAIRYIIGLIQEILFSGTYYHLWYLPAAAIALGIVFLIRRSLNRKTVLAIALILFLIGLLDDSYKGIIPPAVFDAYNKVFLTTRNGVFCGTLFVAVGSYITPSMLTISHKRKYVCFSVILSFLLILESVLNYKLLGIHVNNMLFVTIPLTAILFKLALQFQTTADTKKLRHLSELIYFVHPAVLVVVGKAINNGLISGVLGMSLSLGSAWLLSIMINKIRALRILI